MTFKRGVWKKKAREELEAAFPGVHIPETSAHVVHTTKEERDSVQTTFRTAASFNAQYGASLNLQLHIGRKRKACDSDDQDQVSSIFSPLGISLAGLSNLEQRAIRISKITAFWVELVGIIQDLMPSDSDRIGDVGSFLAEHRQPSLEDWDDCYDWEELPAPLAEFIQQQDGLKIDKIPISSRGQLETAYHLLQKCKGNPKDLSIVRLAVSVLYAYGWVINLPRKDIIDDLLVLCAPPKNIVPRKCSRCDQKVLDDPFAYWAKYDENFLFV